MASNVCVGEAVPEGGEVKPSPIIWAMMKTDARALNQGPQG